MPFAFPMPPAPPLTGNTFTAAWSAPAGVRTLLTTRLGGVSTKPYAGCNLALHVGDKEAAVNANRRLIRNQVNLPVIYLNQVHGTDIIRAEPNLYRHAPAADGLWTDNGDFALAVLTADCLPILLCNRQGTICAALHAGWRGLAGGIIPQLLAAIPVSAGDLLVYLGPAISQDAFEVGSAVKNRFTDKTNDCYELQSCFTECAPGKYLADIYNISKKILNYHGVSAIYGGHYCTVLQNKYFFSYRKEGVTGRQAALIWLENSGDKCCVP